MSAHTCHVHGRAGVAHVCRHIRTAIERGGAVPNWPQTLHDYAAASASP